MSEKNKLVFECVNSDIDDDNAQDWNDAIYPGFDDYNDWGPYAQASDSPEEALKKQEKWKVEQKNQEQEDINDIFNNLYDYVNERCILAGYVNKEMQISLGYDFDTIPDGYKFCIYKNFEKNYYWYRFEKIDGSKVDEKYKDMHIIFYTVDIAYDGDELSQFKESVFNIMSTSKANALEVIDRFIKPCELELLSII